MSYIEAIIKIDDSVWTGINAIPMTGALLRVDDQVSAFNFFLSITFAIPAQKQPGPELQLFHVIRFYHKTNKNQAAIWRINDHIKQHPKSPFIEEALFIMGECQYREQAYRAAASTFITLIEKHPKGEYSDHAAELARNIKLQGK